MGKNKKKSKDKNGNPKPPKRSKTEPAKPKPKPARSAKPKTAPSAKPVPALAQASTSQGGGDVEPPEPANYMLGDPLPPRILFKPKPKYWVHNLPDGYGKSAGLVSRCVWLIGVSAGLVAQRRRPRRRGWG